MATSNNEGSDTSNAMKASFMRQLVLKTAFIESYCQKTYSHRQVLFGITIVVQNVGIEEENIITGESAESTWHISKQA